MDLSESRNPIEQLAAEFMRRRRNGESPAISEYVHAYPDFADEIQELFPALEMMESVRKDVVEDSPATANSTTLTRPGDMVGDYRIVRELGAVAWALSMRRSKNRLVVVSR